MNSFKEAAIKILKKSKKPLHYREITKRAKKENLIDSSGKTPWATMNAKLAVDIKENGEKSDFIRTDPGYFSLNPKITKNKSLKLKYTVSKHKINETLTTQQKGDIAEARVAELITLYGKEGLTCYKPISDDEGIDIIVKRRGKLEVFYIQVKSTYGYKNSRGFVSSIKNKRIPNKIRMLLVFVYFDLSEGDIFENIFCIPADKFIKLTNLNKDNNRVFTASINNMDKSKYSEFMIEKRELANRIIEIMDKI